MSPPIAVVDIGTNSTRLLIAQVVEGHVEELERRSIVTRLGDGVDSSGRLSDAAMERVYETVAGYREAIDEYRADPVVAVATSATRDSANGDQFRETLRERYGIDTQIISGEREARLTFLGATAGRDPSQTMLVIDIGGGSTELVIGRPGAEDPGFHGSTHAGGGRPAARRPPSGPPAPGQARAPRGEGGAD